MNNDGVTASTYEHYFELYTTGYFAHAESAMTRLYYATRISAQSCRLLMAVVDSRQKMKPGEWRHWRGREYPSTEGKSWLDCLVIHLIFVIDHSTLRFEKSQNNEVVGDGGECRSEPPAPKLRDQLNPRLRSRLAISKLSTSAKGRARTRSFTRDPFCAERNRGEALVADGAEAVTPVAAVVLRRASHDPLIEGG
jgi:hypothetical protein